MKERRLNRNKVALVDAELRARERGEGRGVMAISAPNINAEQLMRLREQAARLHFFLNRDMCGWAPAGTEHEKLARIVGKAWRRVLRRQSALEARLAARGN